MNSVVLETISGLILHYKPLMRKNQPDFVVFETEAFTPWFGHSVSLKPFSDWRPDESAQQCERRRDCDVVLLTLYPGQILIKFLNYWVSAKDFHVIVLSR